MDRAARLLRGTLRVRVESAFPERVLNLCGAHGIAFSDLRWESASALSRSRVNFLSVWASSPQRTVARQRE